MVRKGKTLKYFIFLLFAVAIGFLFFNESGFLKYLKLKSELNELNEQLEDRKKQNNIRQTEIDSLERKIPQKIEQVAREKYGMVKRGEKVIKVEEK